MARPVNLDNLHAITGGDRTVEAGLFRIFHESSDLCMAGLRRAAEAGDQYAWQHQAHALKGLSFNLGAGPLGRLCQKAQENPTLPATKKEKILMAMQKELARVQKVLEKLA